MTKKLIDIDEERLGLAREILGATTMKETVNMALAEVVDLARRRAHAQRLGAMDGLDLDEDEVMSAAWR
ncbi:MAG: type II toxin-antitoxin system VapB family antitoxin [Egibacteraceae bacterium]